MRLLHLSDTHRNHDQLVIPDGIDLVMHSGDATNYRDPFKNEKEMWEFLEWYGSLDIPNKVFVCGNHDSSVEAGLIKKSNIESFGITYLFNDDVTINGYEIWGSPHTPTFNDWSFMKSRAKIHKVWDTIPEDTDIILTHGPPLGMLDITNRRDNLQEQCGDSALLGAIKRIEPAIVAFGHIHNTKRVYNAGTKQIAGMRTIFSNASCVNDGKWGVITSHGNVIELPDK